MSSATDLPQPVTIRPATPTDFSEVLRVRQEEERADSGASETTAERLTADWEALGSRLSDQVWVAVAADDRLQACADLNVDDDVYCLRVWTPSDSEHPGLETALLAAAERQACAMGRASDSQSIRLFAQATSAHPALQQALVRAGYTVSSTYEQMELALSAPPMSPDAIAGIEIRPLAIGQDMEAIHRADEEAFQDQRGHTPRSYERWRQRLHLGGEPFDPLLWLIAWEADEVAGAALGEVVQGVGWLHHLGVRRPWRRRGVGEALTRAAIGAFYRKGIGTVRLNVDADSLTNAHQLYRRVGFRATRAYANYQKVAPLD